MRRHAEATRRDYVNIHATAPSAPPCFGIVSNLAEAARRGFVNIHATPRRGYAPRFRKYTCDCAVCAAKPRPSLLSSLLRSSPAVAAPRHSKRRSDPETTPRLCTLAECSSLLRLRRIALRRRTGAAQALSCMPRSLLPRGSEDGTAPSAPPRSLFADKAGNSDSVLLLIYFALTQRLQ
jgi:hypothetical protein